MKTKANHNHVFSAGSSVSVSLEDLENLYKEDVVSTDFIIKALEQISSSRYISFQIDKSVSVLTVKIIVTTHHLNFNSENLKSSNVKFLSTRNVSLSLNAKEQEVLFNFTFNSDYVKDYIANNNFLDIQFSSTFIKKDTAFYNVYNEHLNADFKEVLKYLMRFNKNETLDILFVEKLLLKKILMYAQEFFQFSSGLQKDENYVAEESSQTVIEKIELARKILEDNFENDMSISHLAKKVDLKVFQLKRSFKEVFGITLFTYITNLRMNYACKLLKETKLPILEVAEKSGYLYAQSFISAFKTKFKITPSKYRKLNLYR